DGKVVGIVSRADLLRALTRCNDASDWIESDRVLQQRFVDSIKDTPWASRPFTVVVNGGHAALRGFVFSEAEKEALRVAAETTPGIDSVACELSVVPPHVAAR